MNQIKILLKPMHEMIDEMNESNKSADYKAGYEEAMLQAISMVELMIVLLTGKQPGDDA